VNPYICAEAGSCHDGDLDKARAMVQMAKDAGADAVKFQFVSSAELLAERRNAHEYVEAYKIIEFPYPWHAVLSTDCLKAGIDYMCTTYLPEDVEMVAGYVAMFKVASFEAGDRVFLEAHRPFVKDKKKPLVVSTGMGNDALLADLEAFQFSARADLRILHCVSAYPAPMEALNLAVIRERHLHGFSDHTGRVVTGSWAVAAGARMLEVHFRLETTNPANKDFPHALTPARLAQYINHAREAAVAVGSVIKAPQPCEADMARYRINAQ
jgi:N,N'-diacetyllegionaminate synthase